MKLTVKLLNQHISSFENLFSKSHKTFGTNASSWYKDIDDDLTQADTQSQYSCSKSIEDRTTISSNMLSFSDCSKTIVANFLSSVFTIKSESSQTPLQLCDVGFTTKNSRDAVSQIELIELILHGLHLIYDNGSLQLGNDTTPYERLFTIIDNA